MVSIWFLLWTFGAGCVCGFFLYGCIDNQNNRKEG